MNGPVRITCGSGNATIYWISSIQQNQRPKYNSAECKTTNAERHQKASAEWLYPHDHDQLTTCRGFRSNAYGRSIRSSNRNPLCEILLGWACSQVSLLRPDQVGPGRMVEGVSDNKTWRWIITDHSHKGTSESEPKLVACFSIIGLLHCQRTQEVLGCLLVSAYVQASKRQWVSISILLKQKVG